MGKETGLGNQLYYNGIDLSGDSQSVNPISKSITLLPFTGIDKSAHERKAGLLDGRIAWKPFFNPTGAHAILEDMPRTDCIATFMHRATVGVPAASLVCKQMDFGYTRGEDGSLLGDVDTLANNYWLDWGLSLTAGKRSDTGATNGATVDFNDWGFGASFGLQAYLQVFSFTGTSVTIKLQDDDNSGMTTPSDITGGAFTVVSSAPQSQRIETGRTLTPQRYLRVVTSGTFSECTFAVMVTVNRTSMVI